jgi:hypothetical protein
VYVVFNSHLNTVVTTIWYVGGLHRIQRFRERADECRRLAEIAISHELADDYRRLADLYDGMAKTQARLEMIKAKSEG